MAAVYILENEVNQNRTVFTFTEGYRISSGIGKKTVRICQTSCYEREGGIVVSA